MPDQALSGLGIPGVDSTQPGLLADRHHRLPRARRHERAERRRLEQPRRSRPTSPGARARTRSRPACRPTGCDRLPELAAQQRHLQLQRPVHRRRLRRLPARLRVLGEPLEVGDAQLPRALHALLRPGRLAGVAAADAEPRAALRAQPAAGRRERRHRQLRSGHRSRRTRGSCWPAQEGDDRASRALQGVNHRLFAPRAGFAYSLPGDKTVIRGGVGIFYANMITVGGMSSLEINPPNHLRISQTTDRTVPSIFLSQGFADDALVAGERDATSTWCPTIAATRCRPRTSGTSTCSASCRAVVVEVGYNVNHLVNNWRSIDGNPAPAGPGNINSRRLYRTAVVPDHGRRRSRWRTSPASRRTAGAATARCRRRSRSATRRACRCWRPTPVRRTGRLEGGYQDSEQHRRRGRAGRQRSPALLRGQRRLRAAVRRSDRRFGEQLGRRDQRRARRLERQPDRHHGVGRAARSLGQRQPVQLATAPTGPTSSATGSSTIRRRRSGSTRRAFVANAPYTFGNAPQNLLRGPGYVQPRLRRSASRSGSRPRVTADLRFESFNATNRVNLGNPNTQSRATPTSADLVGRTGQQQPGRRQASRSSGPIGAMTSHRRIVMTSSSC